MKKLLIAFIALISVTSIAQIEDPTEWSLEVEKLSDTNYKLITTVFIEAGWHVNSQVKVEAIDGPIPTEFAFFGEGYELVGTNKETGSYSMYEKTWKRDVYQFDNIAVFEQEVKLIDASLKYIPVEVYFQVCDAEKCLPPSPKAMAFKIDPTVTVDASKVVNAFYDQGTEPVIASGPEASSVPAKASKSQDSSMSLDGFKEEKLPVAWSYTVEKLSDTNYELIATCEIDEGWHLNSQVKVDAIEGPLPTEFSFFGEGYELLGKNKETGSYSTYEKTWKREVYQFDKLAVFTQEIKLTDPDLAYVPAEIYYQVCDDSKCLPPTPLSVLFKIDPAVNVDADELINSFYDQGIEAIIATGPDASEVKNKDHDNEDSKDQKGLWSRFFIAFILGFGVLLTPCVFPMIPMTVSFFTKQNKNRAKGIRNAFLYGFFIIFIYTGLGSVVSVVFGSNAMYEFSTGVVFNAIMFLVLVLFAMSFMGAFEIMLPNSFMNKVDAKSNKGGIIGIFFMALALAVVSFSCTFPIAGTALLEATTVGGIAPIISMLGFSCAIAIPFMLFAIFPSWLNSLPKSGGWLNTVKVFLGFLELAFALKFLSMIDLVLDWRILDREIFIALWIAIFGTLGLYLLGKIRLPHDSPQDHISVGRSLLAMITIAFTIYLIPGMWGAPLKLISGFPPPMSTNSESPNGVGFMKTTSSGTFSLNQANEGSTIQIPENAHIGPHGLMLFKDYDAGVAYAKEVSKPVLLDFTGITCVNCRKMEEQVWSEDMVLKVLQNEVVLISLYVDDRKELPKSEQYESEFSGNTIRTYGQKWLEYQQKRYNTNAQPLYVIQDLEGNDLNNAVGYTPNVQEYQDWLKKGVNAF